MTQRQRAYLAAMIDADGTISITQRKNGRCELKVYVSGNNKQHISGMRSEYRAPYFWKDSKRAHYYIGWCGAEAIDLLKALLPDFKGKLAQAKLATNYPILPSGRPQLACRRMHLKARRKRKQLRNKMRNLNAKWSRRVRK